MIILKTLDVQGFEPAIHGMRNPKNSWAKSDSQWGCNGDSCPIDGFELGPNDRQLALQLAGAGPVHGKFRRMITVWVDITAPLYWWKEFDTYKVGTVANSCSTMHKIHAKEFTFDDFSVDHLFGIGTESYYDCEGSDGLTGTAPLYVDFFTSEIEDMSIFENGDLVGEQIQINAVGIMEIVIKALNHYREQFIEWNKINPKIAKYFWWQMIQLLPSSYNQTRTVQLNYEVLANICEYRANHKLDEWHDFIKWAKRLPYSELFLGGGHNE